MNLTVTRASTLVVVAWTSSLALAAQTNATGAYPTKSVRLIVPLTAGGPTDILARLIAVPLSESLGQQVIVDNRPGAGGNIGADIVAKSPPDGYTLFMGTSGPLSINSSLYARLPFDPIRDFAPIILAASASFVVIVKIIKDPVAHERMLAADFEPSSTTPEQFAAFIRSETAKWGKVVKASGARPE